MQGFSSASKHPSRYEKRGLVTEALKSHGVFMGPCLIEVSIIEVTFIDGSERTCRFQE